jgi:hypothetical protein
LSGFYLFAEANFGREKEVHEREDSHAIKKIEISGVIMFDLLHCINVQEFQEKLLHTSFFFTKAKRFLSLVLAK